MEFLNVNYWLGLLPPSIPLIVIAIGIAVIIAGNIIKLFLPIQYKIGTIIIVVVGFTISLAGCYVKGRQDILISAQEEIDKLKTTQSRVTEKVVTKYITKIQKVKDKNEEILAMVDTKNDSKCPIPESTVSLLNAASSSSVPEPTKRADDPPSPVTYSEVERTVIENYELYNEVAERLRSLQEWVREQQKLNPGD